MDWRPVERFFDRMIVPALLLLVVIVVADIFYTEIKYEYETFFLYADTLAISVFIGDLSFKFKRARNWKGFLRREWLEVLAIFPFFWVFRIVESVVRVGELVQEIIHLVARGGRLVRLLAVFGVVSRHQRFTEFLRKTLRTDRFEQAAKFYKHPDEEE